MHVCITWRSQQLEDATKIANISGETCLSAPCASATVIHSNRSEEQNTHCQKTQLFVACVQGEQIGCRFLVGTVLFPRAFVHFCSYTRYILWHTDRAERKYILSEAHTHANGVRVDARHRMQSQTARWKEM